MTFFEGESSRQWQAKKKSDLRLMPAMSEGLMVDFFKELSV